MKRTMLIGGLAFGVSAAIAGYVWVAFEFPFAILLPAFVGWYSVVRGSFGMRKAVAAASVGGVTFTGLFLVAMFLALTDGSPLALAAWMAAVLAAGAAGALAGAVLDRAHGARVMSVASAAGMLVATVAAGALRLMAPAAVDTAGAAQNVYVLALLGLVGTIVGAAIGAGVKRLHCDGLGASAPECGPGIPVHG